MEAYGKFPLKHKLFGYGPDTFGILTTDRFFGDMINATGLIFDNAHNEYLQFLLTIGPIGLIAYWVPCIELPRHAALYDLEKICRSMHVCGNLLLFSGGSKLKPSDYGSTFMGNAEHGRCSSTIR